MDFDLQSVDPTYIVAGMIGLGVLFILWLATGIVLDTPAYHYRVPTFLGRRLKYFILEGWGYIPPWPFGGVTKATSMEGRSVEDQVIFTTLDGAEVTVPFTLNFRVNPNIKAQSGPLKGRVLFDSLEEGEALVRLREGVATAISNAGKNANLEAVLSGIDGFDLLVNCVSRLDAAQLPHNHHNALTCGVAGCTLPSTIPTVSLIEFYESHRGSINHLLSDNDRTEREHSDLELLAGCTVERVTVGENIVLDAPTQAARAAQKQAEFQKAAGELVLTFAEQLRERFPDIDQHTAVNMANAFLNRDPRNVIDLGNVGNAFAAFAAAVAAGRRTP